LAEFPPTTHAADWISDHVKLDWAMFACSITPYSHGDVAKKLLKKLGSQGVDVINSAVFNGGFLIGSDWFDYREVKRETDKELFEWRDKFNAVRLPTLVTNTRPARHSIQAATCLIAKLFMSVNLHGMAPSSPACNRAPL
jgi:hypothetical protein